MISWEMAHPLAAQWITIAIVLGAVAIGMALLRYPNAKKIFWLLVAVSFLGSLVHIAIQQPLLGGIAIVGVIGITTLILRRDPNRKLIDENWLQNFRRGFLIFLLIFTAIAVVALLFSFFRL